MNELEGLEQVIDNRFCVMSPPSQKHSATSNTIREATTTSQPIYDKSIDI
jgi:hypothetical protein